MGFEPRRIEKIENLAGTVSVAIPLFDVEWESAQPLRTAQAAVIGSDFGVDLQATDDPGVMDFASERVRCLLYESAGPSTVDTSLDALMSKLWSIGRFKMFTIDSAGDRRYAFGRLRSMPTITWKAGDILSKGLALDLIRLSPWFSTTAISASATKTASPATLDVTNAGNIVAHRVQIRIQSSSAAGFSNIKVVNGANGHVFESTRDAASTNDELRLDTTVPEVTYSTDDGVNRDDDYGDYVEPPAGQKLLSFDMEPGVNTLTITCAGTPNYVITVTGDSAFA